MRVILLIIFLGLFYQSNSFGQSVDGLAPLHSIEFALSSVESVKQSAYRAKIYSFVEQLQEKKIVEYPNFIHQLKDLYLLPHKEQESIIIPLLKLMGQSKELELLYIQTLSVFSNPDLNLPV